MGLARVIFPLLRPMLHGLDPETVHQFSMLLLRLAPRRAEQKLDKRLAVTAFGLNFPNPLGLAAGFDKNAVVPDALCAGP